MMEKYLQERNLCSTFVPAKKRGAIAQLVEQRTENPCVPGSIPGGTTKNSRLRSSFCLVYNSFLLNIPLLYRNLAMWGIHTQNTVYNDSFLSYISQKMQSHYIQRCNLVLFCRWMVAGLLLIGLNPWSDFHVRFIPSAFRLALSLHNDSRNRITLLRRLGKLTFLK